jgi:hypothetical protein
MLTPQNIPTGASVHLTATQRQAGYHEPLRAAAERSDDLRQNRLPRCLRKLVDREKLGHSEHTVNAHGV